MSIYNKIYSIFSFTENEDNWADNEDKQSCNICFWIKKKNIFNKFKCINMSAKESFQHYSIVYTYN